MESAVTFLDFGPTLARLDADFRRYGWLDGDFAVRAREEYSLECFRAQLQHMPERSDGLRATSLRIVNITETNDTLPDSGTSETPGAEYRRTNPGTRFAFRIHMHDIDAVRALGSEGFAAKLSFISSP